MLVKISYITYKNITILVNKQYIYSFIPTLTFFLLITVSLFLSILTIISSFVKLNFIGCLFYDEKNFLTKTLSLIFKQIIISQSLFKHKKIHIKCCYLAKILKKYNYFKTSHVVESMKKYYFLSIYRIHLIDNNVKLYFFTLLLNFFIQNNNIRV